MSVIFFFFFSFFFFSSARVTPPEHTSELASRRGRPSNTYRRRSFHCDVDAVCHGNPTDGGGASSIAGRFFFLFFFSSPVCHATPTHTQSTHHSPGMDNKTGIKYKLLLNDQYVIITAETQQNKMMQQLDRNNTQLFSHNTHMHTKHLNELHDPQLLTPCVACDIKGAIFYTSQVF